MGIRSSIRNFFYAMTHANQLVHLQQEMYYVNDEIRIKNESRRRIDEKYKQIKSVHTPLPLTTVDPIGRIDELGTDGNVVNRLKFWSNDEFINCVEMYLYLGDPVSITVYSNPTTGAHIDTSWQSRLWSPHQSLTIVPFNPVAELTDYFHLKELQAEIDMRLFPHVAIESTADYTDPEFHKETVDIDIQNEDGSFGRVVDKYRVVTINNAGCHITAMTRPLSSYEAAMEAISANPTIKLIPYEELVQEAESRRWAKDTARDITGYSTEQLQQAIDQLDRPKSISERPGAAQLPENMPVGRIDYLAPNGKVRESLEYRNEGAFVSDVLHSNYYGEPMSITVYSDPKTGAHIDASWRLEMDPPLQGFQVTPYQEPQAEDPELVPIPEPDLDLEM